MSRAGNTRCARCGAKLFWLLFFALAAWAPRAHCADAALALNDAQFLLSDADTPPGDSAPWQAVRLPDNWNLTRPGVGGFGWYRLQFVLPQRPQDGWALYVRKLSMNAAFYVNGSFVRSGGRFTEPVARHWNRPLLFAVSPALLRPGMNTIHVRLWAYANSRGGLGELRLGPETLLHPEYEQRYFVQTILPQLCNIVVAAFGVFAFALWLKQREALYILFAVFTVLWAIRSLHMFARDIPVSAFYWDIWVQSSFGWCALLFTVLAIRMAGLHWPRFEKVLLAYAVLGPTLMYLSGPQHLHHVANNWSFVIVPTAAVFDALLLRQAWRQRTLVSALFAVVLGLMIAASVHDGLVHRDKLAFDSFYIVSYVMIGLALVMGWVLINRFVAAWKQAEQLNRELEQRVAQKHAELQQNFERLQELERRTAVAEERRRLMSEMHDGVGAQLIATLDLIERGGAQDRIVANELRECLDHLRLTIDSLEPTDNDLLTVLGNLRYRLEGRLRRVGVALSWQVQDLPALPSLTPQNVLHVLRILQEAFTNIIKHANAGSITLSTTLDASHVCICVEDDGHGLPAAPQRQGRGLLNMRRRAHEMGALLDIRARPGGGTAVSLHLPRELPHRPGADRCDAPNWGAAA